MKIGLDLGGTNFRVGLVDTDRLVCKEVVPCPQGSEKEVNDALLSLVGKVMTDEVTSIGVGVPSVVDRERGIVYNAANIPSWKEVHLKEIMEERFHRPVFINNDANCFTLGVHVFGEGRGYRDMVGLTLGTGVGAGLIINGRLYNGHNTGAGEVGSLPFREKDYEHYCASRFFQDFHTTGKALAEEGRQGEPRALEIWRHFGDREPVRRRSQGRLWRGLRQRRGQRDRRPHGYRQRSGRLLRRFLRERAGVHLGAAHRAAARHRRGVRLVPRRDARPTWRVPLPRVGSPTSHHPLSSRERWSAWCSHAG